MEREFALKFIPGPMIQIGDVDQLKHETKRCCE